MGHAIVEQEKKAGVSLFGVTETICVQVSEFKGKMRVDIRKWWQNKEDNKFYRSPKGLNITTDEWDDFVAQIGEIDSFVREQSTGKLEH